MSIPLKADFIIVIPPDHMVEVMGIKVIDYTAINATTLKPKETRPVSLRKLAESRGIEFEYMGEFGKSKKG